MGLLDGKKALVFGVANDHSIAWGIARALHEQGAMLGFSSIAELSQRRVKPLAASIGSTFVEPCNVQNDDELAAVFEKWKEQYGTLDILIHSLAFAGRDALTGRFVDTTRDQFPWRWGTAPTVWRRPIPVPTLSGWSSSAAVAGCLLDAAQLEDLAPVVEGDEP